MKKGLIFKFNRISDNRGSTLITVIVAIAFVTILTSIILGTTVVNVRMKGIDKRAKDDFYYAERSLNDIYTGLGQELAVEAGKQYEIAFEKVGTTDSFSLAESAEKEFHKLFMTEVINKMKALTADRLEEYILPASKGHVISIGTVEKQKKDGSIASGEAGVYSTDTYRVVLKDVQVYVEDSAKFRSTIATDIVVTFPTVDFLGTNADVSDYGLIANEGLYIKGNSEITGNVYAGVHETAKDAIDTDLKDEYFEEYTDKNARGGTAGGSYKGLYGGINIKDGKATFDGNYIISKGDINLSGNNPQIKVNSSGGGAGGNLANLWFTSIRTIRTKPDGNKGAVITNAATNPTIDINANIFALNDMALNADKSSAVIKGNYYGYNEGGLTNILQKKTGRDDGGNSAIIVNGNKASLDMRGVNNFVLMGKAYIDFTSVNTTDAGNTGTQVVPTAESVALKTNQQLYLVPPDFLDGPNPAEDSEDSHSFTINYTDPELKDWFGYKYLDPSKHKSYKVAINGSTQKVYYDYLVFDEYKTWKIADNNCAALGVDDDDTVYIVKKDPSGSGFKIVKYISSTDPLGTGGSISSKAMFFLKIMMSDTAYEYAFNKGTDPDIPAPTAEETDPGTTEGRKKQLKEERFKKYKDIKESKVLLQPSEYRLRERINLSMANPAYFDLGQCVVGGGATDAHYYAKNAVVNYEKVNVVKYDGTTEDIIQSNVLDNTEGMLRYSGYTQNLFKRYMLLCTKLDGQEDKLLEASIEGDANDPDDWPDWKMTTQTPLSHCIKIANIDTMNIGESLTSTTDPPKTCANSEGLKPGAFGVVIATNGTLTINSALPGVIGNTFKGIAIVKGDIIVDTNINVDGLLMATGTITLRGGNTINYDKGLIQSRIEKEMDIVRNKESSTLDKYKGKKGYMNYYLISYLAEDGTLIYDVEPGSRIKREKVEADYNDFMHYENWQKGEK